MQRVEFLTLRTPATTVCRVSWPRTRKTRIQTKRPEEFQLTFSCHPLVCGFFGGTDRRRKHEADAIHEK